MNPTVDCANIQFFRDDKLILSNISFKMKRGEILLIKGENGVGKTTLLKIISGILFPYSGSVVCNSPIAYLGHKNACRDDITVEENLKFWSKIKGNIELILPTMVLFDLLPLKDALYKNLSSGYKRKVALAKMMVLDADIWILDEPFANLDDKNKRFLSELIDSKAQSGIVIFTCHEDVNLLGEVKTLVIKEPLSTL